MRRIALLVDTSYVEHGHWTVRGDGPGSDGTNAPVSAYSENMSVEVHFDTTSILLAVGGNNDKDLITD